MTEDTNNSELTEAESIEWIIPANNTMIKLNLANEGLIPQEDGFYHIIRKGE
jgi:hypothetical protein